MKIHEDGQYSQIKWCETRSDQAAALPLFTERCGSKLVLVIASCIGEHLERLGGGLYGQILPFSPDV